MGYTANMWNTADRRRNGALLVGVVLLTLFLLASNLQRTARGEESGAAEFSLTASPTPQVTIIHVPQMVIIERGIGKYGSLICWVGQYCPELDWMRWRQPQNWVLRDEPQVITLLVLTATPTGTALPSDSVLPQQNTPDDVSDGLPPCTDIIDPRVYDDHYAPDRTLVFMVEQDMDDHIQLIPICN